VTLGRWLQTAAEALSAAAGSTSGHPTASRRDAVALRVAEADHQPSLLRLLDIAQLPGAVLRANASTTSALGLLVGCRNWMYRNPDQIRAAHLGSGHCRCPIFPGLFRLGGSESRSTAAFP
jgi:hypothetical protein